MQSDDQILVYSVSAGLLGIMMMLTFVMTRWSLKSRNIDTDIFVTARRTQGWLKIACTFFASSYGSSALVMAPWYGYTYGVFGIIAISLGHSIPIVLVAHVGAQVAARMRRPLSLADFVQWRYGTVYRVFIVIVSLMLTMLMMVYEYESLGKLFGGQHGMGWPAIVMVCVATGLQSSYSGLLVAIGTDTVQCGIALILLLVGIGWTLAEQGTRSTSNVLVSDWVSASPLLLSVPLGMMCRTLFSESFWQRIWAADSRKAMLTGAYTASGAMTIVLASLASIGCLLRRADSQVLVYTRREYAYSLVQVHAIVMSNAMCQAQQHGMTGILATGLASTRPIGMIRLVSALANMCAAGAAIALGCWGTNPLVLQRTQMLVFRLCACAGIPCAIGAYTDDESGQTGLAVSGTLVSLVSVLAYALLRGSTATSELMFDVTLASGALLGFYAGHFAYYTWFNN